MQRGEQNKWRTEYASKRGKNNNKKQKKKPKPKNPTLFPPVSYAICLSDTGLRCKKFNLGLLQKKWKQF